MALKIPRWTIYVILLLALAGVLALFVMFPIVGADFYYIFYPSARAVWAGDTFLYGTDNSLAIYYPAHAMFYWMLLALAPLALANALQLLCTGMLMMGTAHLWKEFSRWDFLTVVLGIVNPFTLDQIIRGQIDALAVFGLVLAYLGVSKKQPHTLGLGATLAMIKPTSLALPLLLIAWSLRRWSWRELLKAAVIPLLVLLATLLVFDFGWPLRFFERVKPPIPYTEFTMLTIWILAETAKIPVLVPYLISGALLIGVLKHRELTAENFALALVVGYLISPYVGAYHYVALLPALMTIRSRRWVVLCWLLSFFVFARIAGFSYSWLTMLYPIALCMGLLWQMVRGESEKLKVESEGWKADSSE
jgi:hypothetical protein